MKKLLFGLLISISLLSACNASDISVEPLLNNVYDAVNQSLWVSGAGFTNNTDITVGNLTVTDTFQVSGNTSYINSTSPQIIINTAINVTGDVISSGKLLGDGSEITNSSFNNGTDISPNNISSSGILTVMGSSNSTISTPEGVDLNINSGSGKTIIGRGNYSVIQLYNTSGVLYNCSIDVSNNFTCVP